MKITRRDALKLATRGWFAEREKSQTFAVEQQVRWGMVVDLRKCIGCQACTVACQMENGVPIGYYRTRASLYEITLSNQAHRSSLPRLCNHCDNPPCTQVCPTQATFQRPDGIVLVDNTVCIGCGYCVQTCPYGARFIHPETQTTDKCTFCFHRVDAGLLPACVETCVGGARVFGNLNDPNSQVSQLLSQYQTRTLKPDLNTQPMVHYINLDGILQDKVESETLNMFGNQAIEEG